MFLRTTHSIALTAAGDSFRLTAEETLRRLSAGRSEAVELAQGASEILRFASTNALALIFFPNWLRRVEATLPFHISIQLLSNHMEACERIMIEGQTQFLLCHHHPAAVTLLAPGQFRSLHVGDDVLMPVTIPSADDGTRGLFQLPGTAEAPVPYLSYQPESGMGQIVAAQQKISSKKAWLKPVFTSHLAKLLETMAMDGRGMAWLPKSLIDEALEMGKLVRAGDEAWDIPIEIHIFRSRARQSAVAERFWSHIESPPG